MLTQEQKNNWLSLGFDFTTLPHRELLMEKITKHNPTSVLDVGCATGPDLALLKVLLPNTYLQGIDKEPQNIEEASRLDVDLVEANLIEALPQIRSKSFDVVFTNGVMMYNDRHWIKELLRIAKKAVVLSERFPTDEQEQYMVALGYQPTKTKITQEIRDSWKTNGYIYELML